MPDRPRPDGLGTARYRHVRWTPQHRVHAHLHSPVRPRPGGQTQPRHATDPRLASADAGGPQRTAASGDRVMNAPPSAAAITTAAAPAWSWPIDPVRYDRTSALSVCEQATL